MSPEELIDELSQQNWWTDLWSYDHGKVLVLNARRLGRLPDSIGNLRRIKTADLRGNNLTDLPPSFERLIKLEELDLGENLFRTIPPCVARLPRLRGLLLPNNELERVPDLGGFGSLESLHLGGESGNKISEFPMWLNRLPRLKLLILHNNRIGDIPDWVTGFPELESLILSKNRLHVVPASLLKLPKLRRLELEDNLMSPDQARSYSNLVRDRWKGVGQ